MVDPIRKASDLSSWKLVDEFLAKERDSFFSAVTHIHLGFAAVLVVSILLGGYSLWSPLTDISQLDRKDWDGAEALFIMTLLLTAGMVLALVVLALQKIRHALIKSFGMELQYKAKALRTTAERFNIELPSSTIDLLKSIETL
jgi:hypothetical protein